MSQPIRPMLGDLELQQVRMIQLDEDQVLTRHDVPALEGDFFQNLGRAGAAIEMTGIQSGTEAREGLNALREVFRAGEPLTFAADIVTATALDRVLIDRFEIAEQAGLPDAYEYRLRLREYTEAETPEPVVPPPPPPPPPLENDGVLVVTVVKENDPGFDPSTTTVTISGTPREGQPFQDRPLTNRAANRWTEDPFPAGEFTAVAVARGVARDGGDLTGSVPATVRPGETTEVTITLREDSAAALRFLIHFRFDSAFIEPCLKAVLRQVADFAAGNAGMKLLPVGHTDLAGSTAYNQSLSERRARSAFAVLRFGNDRQAAIDEWNELRKRRTPGTTRSLNDTWGAREYQQMLQDRGFYTGRIDGDHGPQTDTAVRAFQAANGLTGTGTVDDTTWRVLIEAYLAAENLSVPDDRFLPNCAGEFLKWLGCSELDPVRDTEDAWRPNRRTEFLFTRAAALPADVAEPDTFNLPAPGAVAAGWCLNDSGTTTRTCFTARYPGVAPKETCPSPPARGPALTRQPAEASPSFVVQGSIRFEDGTPYAGSFFVTASDGEYMSGERARTSGGERAGTPLPDRPDATGAFAYPDKPKTPGIFIIEIDDDVVARKAGAPLEEAKGPVVCKRLAAGTDRFDVVIVDHAVAQFIPSITAPQAVVVRRPHTNPARQPVVLRVNAPFTGTGTLTISEGAGRIRVFDAPAAGTELTFDGSDNVFTADQLVAGHTVFVEGGPDPSAAADDVELSLQLTVNGQPGFADRARLTSVRLTLDIAEERLVPFIDPPVLSEADKANPGRLLQVQNGRLDAARALVVVRRAEPAAFTGDLVLGAINDRVRLFGPADEVPAAGQTALALPQTLGNATVPLTGPPLQETGLRFFAEGARISAAPRDTGFQLGIAGLEPDGDRVAVTVTLLAFVQNTAPFDAAVGRAQIEGVLNSARGSFDIGDLFGTQAASLFRLRAMLPGVTTATVTADLVSRQADGTAIETVAVTLNRQGATSVYVSATPILAIPMVIPRADITFAAPRSIEVVRSHAGGALSFTLRAPNAGAGRATAAVRGRVLEFCTITIQGAAPNAARDLATGNRVIAQCGAELRNLSSTTVNNPVLLDIQQANCPFTIGGLGNRSAEERALFSLGRTTCASNFIMYYVRSLSTGLLGCAAFVTGQPGASVGDGATQYTFVHEMGHVLNLRHTNDPANPIVIANPAVNLMTGTGTGGLPAQPNNVFIEAAQCLAIDASGRLVFRG